MSKQTPPGGGLGLLFAHSPQPFPFFRFSELLHLLLRQRHGLRHQCQHSHQLGPLQPGRLEVVGLGGVVVTGSVAVVSELLNVVLSDVF